MVSRQFVAEYYILQGNIQKDTEKEPRKPFLSFEAIDCLEGFDHKPASENLTI